MMGYLSLMWAGLWRKPLRTLLTIVSLTVGFFLFGLLQGVNSAFDTALTRSRVDRLLIGPRFDTPLPVSYFERIKQVAGVAEVTWTGFLRGSYQDPKQGVLVITTEPRSFFSVRHEYLTSPAQLAALTRTRTGLIVLDNMARRFGWKVGDRITVSNSIPRKDGTSDWPFDIVGILTDPSNPGQIDFAVGNFDYLNEGRAQDAGTVTRYVIRVGDPRRSAATAHAIDAAFANSAAPTLSQAENEFAGRDLATIGDVGRLTVAVIIAISFALLFLTGNVVLQSVRERTAEFAVLKTIGYRDRQVMTLVVLEALALCLTGALLGLGLAGMAFPSLGRSMTSVSAWLGSRSLSWSVLAAGLGCALILTGLSAALPVWNARRLNVIDALRTRA
ncbi:MAG TPA: FtsX-like permease family protein [Steroidobacteraceae bacterium]|jgi:putative ABC transport system permease protein|nr:FtsX-like permease family protein [Steroidobacteraceae bacterium]